MERISQSPLVRVRVVPSNEAAYRCIHPVASLVKASSSPLGSHVIHDGFNHPEAGAVPPNQASS